MRSPALQLLAKLAALLVAVALLQVVLVGPMWHHRIWAGKDLRDFKACMARQPDVVHLCDSSNFWTGPEDADHGRISDYLDQQLGPLVAARLDGGAFHAGMYEAFLDLMIATGRRPRALVMPINLRSFSLEWDLKPAYAFEERMHQIRHADSVLASAAIPVLRTFQWMEGDTLDQQAFLECPVWLGTNQVGKVEDFDNPASRQPTPERVRNRLIYYYLYPLEKDHRRLAAFRRISDKAAAAGIRVVFYITPIDFQTGERHLPGQFLAQVRANIRVVQETLADHQPPVLDLSTALPSRDFATEDYPNEHLMEAGRRFVAEQLAWEVKRVLEPRQESRMRVP